jgi:hypothetical protein
MAGAFHGAMKLTPGCGEKTGRPADRGRMVDRAFALDRGRSEPGRRSLRHRHLSRCAPVECAAGGLVAPWPNDGGRSDTSPSGHPLPHRAAPSLGSRRYNRLCAGRDELSVAAHQRGPHDAGQFPSFTDAADRQKPSTVAGLILPRHHSLHSTGTQCDENWGGGIAARFRPVAHDRLEAG